MNVQEFYEQVLAERGFTADAAQRKAVERLQYVYDQWVTYKMQRATTLRRLINRPAVPRGSSGMVKRRSDPEK